SLPSDRLVVAVAEPAVEPEASGTREREFQDALVSLVVRAAESGAPVEIRRINRTIGDDPASAETEARALLAKGPGGHVLLWGMVRDPDESPSWELRLTQRGPRAAADGA